MEKSKRKTFWHEIGGTTTLTAMDLWPSGLRRRTQVQWL